MNMRITGTIFASLTLCACAATSATEDGPAAEAETSAAIYAASAAADTYDVRQSMQHEVNPAIVAIWDVTNNAVADDGSLDPALIDAAGWQTLITASARLEAEGDLMANAATLMAASPGNMAVDELEVPMEDVQRYIDANPAGFRAMGAHFARLSARLGSAAAARNPALTGDLVAEMDEVCAACHAVYWYAEAQ